MANGGKIIFDVGFNTDASGLQKALQELKSIQTLEPLDIVSLEGIDTVKIKLDDAKKAANELGIAFESSFNKDIGVLNLSKFEEKIKSIGDGTLRGLQQRLAGAGEVGSSAFRKIYTEILTTNTYVKETDKLISNIATTLGNTLKWNISSSAINKLTGSIQEAWGFTKALDGSLNDIQIVTNKSSEDMKKFAIQANDAAKALGTTTTAYTNASLTFYQQGLSDEDVAARAETSLKVSNVTGLSGDQSAEYVTAVLNGYKVAAEDAENAMDKLAAVGAATASSLAELSEGMAKVASAANAMGVSEDQLAATLATVISVTRQDASTVGTAFKTIYARISDIKAGSEDAEVSLGNYTKKMAEMGFSVLDSAGNMRDLGEVMEEIGGKWETLTREQQISLAQTMAGTRQYNNLIALFDNWAQYEDALNVSMDANGTLQKQQEIYAESYTAKLNELTAAKEKLFMSFVDNDSMKGMIEALTGVTNLFSNFIEGIGGGGTALLQLGAIALRVFGKQISASIQTVMKNIAGMKQSIENSAAKMRMITDVKQGSTSETIAKITAQYEKIDAVINTLDADQQNMLLNMLSQESEIIEQKTAWEADTKAALEYIKTVTDGQLDIESKMFKTDDKGKKQITGEGMSAEETAQFNRAFNKKEKQFVGDSTALNEQLSTLKEISKIEKEIDAINKNGGKNAKKLSASDKARLAELQKQKAELQEVELSYEEMQAVIKRINDEDLKLIDDETTKAQIKSITNELEAALERCGDSATAAIDEDVKRLAAELEAVMLAADKKFADKKADVQNQTSTQSGQRGANLQSQSKDAEKTVDKGISDAKMQAKIQNFTNLTSAIMGVASAIMALQNIGSIWNNDDLSTGQKILQTVMAVGGAIMSLIPMYSMLVTATAAKAAANKAETATTAAKNTQLKTEIGLKTTLLGLNPALLAGTLLVTAAVVAFGFAVGGAAEKISEEEQALNRSTAAAESAQQQYQAAAEAYNSIKSAVEDNQNAADAIAKLTKNTQEWRDSIAEANQKTLELMQNFPALAAAISTNSDGLLVLDTSSEAYQDFINKQNEFFEFSKILAATTNIQKGQDTINKTASENGVEVIDFNEYAIDNVLTSIYNRQSVDTMTASDEKLLPYLEGIQNAIENSDYKEATKLYKEGMEKGIWSSDVYGTSTDFSTDKAVAIANEIIKNNYNTKDIDWSKLNLTEEEIAALNLDLESTNSHFINLSKSIEGTQSSIDGFKTTLDSVEFKNEDKYTEQEQILTKNYVAAQNDENSKYYELALQKMGLNGQWADKKGTEKLDTKDDVIDSDDEAQWYLKNIRHLDDMTASTAKYDSDSGTIKYSGGEINVEGITGEDIAKALSIELASQSDSIVQETTDALKNVTDANGEKISDAQLDAVTAMFSQDLTDIREEDLSQLLDSDGNLLFDEEILKQLATIFNFEDVEVFKRQLLTTISERASKTDEDMRQMMLDKFKNQAQTYNEGITEILNNKEYATNDYIQNNGTVQSLLENKDEILQAKPELEDELKILESTTATTEQRLAVLQKIQEVTAVLKKDEDGIYTKEEAKEDGASLQVLDQEYARGSIDESEYNTKFLGTLDAETEALGLDTEAVHDNAEALQDMALSSDEVADSLAEDSKAALKVAKDNARMNKGLEKLGSNFDDLADSIKNSGEGTEEYTSAMNEMKDIMGDVLNIDPDMMSTDFIVDNLDLIQKAAEGDTDAIQQLRVEASNDILMNVMGISDFSSLDEELQNEIAYVNQLAADNNFEIGASLDDSEFLAACMDIVNQAGMTAEQATAYLASMGIDATVTEVPVEETATRTVSYPVIKQVGGFYTVDDIKTQTFKDTYSGSAGVALEVSNATYTGKSGGTVNRKNTSGGKGKGGGGGGSKPKKPDKMDKSNDEIDRYHNINIAIKQLATQFDRLGKAQDKLVGQDLINNLNQQLRILEKQIDAYQEKLALERQEVAELQGDLSGKGVTFNADGTISNYAESLKAQEDYVNSLIEKYNNMSAEEQEAYKEVVEQAKEDFEKFKENIERYDTIITDEIPGLEDQIQDAFDQQIEINIKKFTMSVELRLEMKQAEEDWNKFKRKIIDSIKDENILGQGLEEFENLKDYFDLGDGTGTVQTLTNQVNNTMAEIEKIQNGGTSDVYGDNLATALGDLQKYNTELMTQLEDIDDLITNIEQGYLDTMDEVSENMEKQVESYEYINDLIESDIELVKLLYGEDAYDSLGAYYSQKHDNYLKAIDFDRKEVDFWETEMNKAKQAGDTEAYNKALEKYRESISRLNEDVNSSVQNIIDQYSNAINKIFDNLDKKFTGGQGLEFMQEEWELINANADRYLDTINSTYEVQKLQSKYQDAINNTDSISAQKKLNALMEEEIGMLEKKDKLSQYDIDRANMKYEIALKQIALEEAQKNKSSMKMKRDAQGNYSYAYAGDEEDISAKQQELADAQNQLYNLDKEQYQQNLNDMMSYYADFTDKYKELMLDTTLSDEEREKKKAMLIEQYGALINSIQTDNETIRRNLSESTFDMLDVLYETDAISFELMTGLNANNWETMSDVMINKIQTDLVPSWESGIQEMINLITEEGGLEPTCKEAFEEIEQSVEDFKNKLVEVQDAAKISFDEISNGQDNTLDKNKELLEDNEQLIKDAQEQLEEYQKLRTEVENLAKAYDAVRDAAMRAAQAAHTLAEEINTQSANAKNDSIVGPNMSSNSSNGAGGANSGGSNNGGGNGSNNGGSNNTGSGSSSSSNTSSQTKKYYVTASHPSYGTIKTFGGPFTSRGEAETYIVTHESRLKSNGVLYKAPTIVEKYKTGGYTGNWTGGSDEDGGKLAFLHQKELVLNAEDTENYLQAVQEMRKLQSEVQNGTSMNILGNIFDAIADSINIRIADLQRQAERSDFRRSEFGLESSSMNQNIVINADFPDVSDAAEIQKAFDQILGMASQKANNKSR